jgi:hypothetical protein
MAQPETKPKAHRKRTSQFTFNAVSFLCKLIGRPTVPLRKAILDETKVKGKKKRPPESPGAFL